jgi:siroheme synthase (precorrin-2 oxidase/ferrochelatase)
MTKSPTEAKLVGLTDNVDRVELFEEFVCFLMNRASKTSKVVSLVTKGGGAVLTKHLRARINSCGIYTQFQDES